MRNFLLIMSRILISHIFIFSGLGKIANWNATLQQMQNEGMIMVPFMLVMAVLFEVGGGLSILFGFRPRIAQIGSIILILFLIPTTFIFHDFWKYEGVQQRMQMINFMKNLAIMGGLLAFYLLSEHFPGISREKRGQ